ncbi:MAG: hypothetical protein EWM73_00258 [Nitrospira sp.]|nr:MAG: hypothetical protein EWM73_00258 [Nitrospira sp.]
MLSSEGARNQKRHLEHFHLSTTERLHQALGSWSPEEFERQESGS